MQAENVNVSMYQNAQKKAIMNEIAINTINQNRQHKGFFAIFVSN